MLLEYKKMEDEIFHLNVEVEDLKKRLKNDPSLQGAYESSVEELKKKKELQLDFFEKKLEPISNELEDLEGSKNN